METASNLLPETEAVVERVRMPTPLVVGRYNAQGKKDDNGNVFIGPQAAGITNVWAAFTTALKPGQRGEMILENLPGTKVINGIVTEWIPGAPGQLGPGLGDDKSSKFNIPNIGVALIATIGLQRGEGAVKVIGLNTYKADAHIAAGIIIPVTT